MIDTIAPTSGARQGVPGQRAVLPAGGRMPLLGFGTFRLDGQELHRSIAAAVETGLRHFDTATSYGNERALGNALAGVGLDRDDLFLTSKLPPAGIGAERSVLESSLSSLRVARLDLWLLHHPPSDELLVPTWEAMLELQDEGLVTDLGVSNFSLVQLDRLTEATGRPPGVNQLRWNPFLYDPELAAELAARGVLLSGYTPLRRANLDDSTLRGVADELGASAAQTILAWHLQRGWSVLFRSSRPERIRENARLAHLELTAAQLGTLDGLRGSYVVP